MTLRRSVAAIMLAPFLAALASGCGTIIHGGRLGGTEVTYTLTRKDVTLSGSGMGADGLLQTISVAKQAQ